MTPLVRFDHVSKHFFNRYGRLDVINDISFDVYQDEIVALVGPSGAGKSTILNLISNLIKPDNGHLDITDEFGYMFQRDNLFNWRTVKKNVLLGLEIRGKVKKEDVDYTFDLLKKYGLQDFIDAYPTTLSGGMRQRVALIRTLALKPKLLLLDEPFSALDYITRLNLADDVYRIIKSEHKSALIVTHDISEAISFSDRVLVLSNRPARIIGSHEIKLDFNDMSKTPTNARTLKEFQTYFNKIYKELNNETQD